MSRCEVYAIDAASGDVVHYGEAQNAWGGAMLIWRELAREHGVDCPVFTYEPLWKVFGTGKLPLHDDVALGFTFDRVWIARANLPRLIEALDAFYQRHPHSTGVELLAVLRRAAADAGTRGVCFNQTSVCSNPWRLYAGPDDEEGRPFNFDRDTRLSGGPVWELFEDLDAMRAEKGGEHASR